jgi:hypothetical protein
MTLRPDQRDGEFVEADAIDHEGQSTNREKYLPELRHAYNDSKPERAAQTAIASTTPGDLPPEPHLSNGVEWEFRVYDRPLQPSESVTEPQALSHAEIRMERLAKPWECKDKPKTPTLRSHMQQTLALRFRVVCDDAGNTLSIAPPAS